MQINLIALINSGSRRSRLAKINIVTMLVIKGLSILLQLILMPLTIHYVSSSVYGLWISLSSIVAWMSFFDIGINNGLKNRYIQAIACNDYDKAKQLVSTTYAFLLCIFVPVVVIGLIVNQFLNWCSILNISYDSSINSVVSVIIVYFASNFVFSTVNVIMSAEQKPAYASIIHFLQQLFTFIVVWILTLTTDGTLMKLCLALCLPPIIIIVAYNIYLYKGKYKQIAPSYKYINFKLVRDLFTFGLKFFVIQIAVIVLYQTSNFLMIRYYGPDAVTKYNIAYKYFFTLNMIFAIAINPIWAAVTDAIAKGDKQWIQNVFKKYVFMMFGFMGLAMIMLFASNYVYRLWMGDAMGEIPFVLSAIVCIYVCITLCGSLMAMFLNGAGYLKLQFINCTIAPFIFLGLSYIFIHVLNLGVYCIPLAIIISCFYSYIISPLQCFLVFFRNKKGLWVK